MLNDSELKSILENLQLKGISYYYSTLDRDIYMQLDDVSPYVVGFKSEIRGFTCQGLSELGKAFLDVL